MTGLIAALRVRPQIVQRVASQCIVCLRRHIRQLAYPALMLCLALPWLTHSQPALAQNQARYTVAVLPDSPPMSMHDERGQLTGFNVDYARLLCAELGGECVFKETYLEQLIDVVRKGQVDFAVAALVRTPERESQVLYTRPYYRGTTFWVLAKTKPPLPAGTRILVITGSRQFAYLEQHKAKGWKVAVRKTHRELLSSLLHGEADAALLPLGTTAYLFSNPDFLAQHWHTQPLDEAKLDNAASIVVTPSKPDLRKSLDEAIATLAANGQFSRLNSRYFPFRID